MSDAFKEKEVKIFHAILQLGDSQSFHDMKIADIARQAGIGKGTVYEYFDSKTAILEGFINFVFCSHLERLTACGEQQSSPLAQLWAMIAYEYSISCQHRQLMAMFSGNSDDSAHLKALVHGHLATRMAAYRTVIAAYSGDERQTEQALDMTTLLFVGAMTHSFFNIREGKRYSLRQVFEHAVNAIIGRR